MPGGVNLQQRHLIGKSLVRWATEIFIPANDFRIPAAGSGGHATSGSLYQKVAGADINIPTISPSSSTCDMVVQWAGIVPTDAATTGSITPYLETICNLAQSTAGSTVTATLNYNFMSNAASLTTAGSVTGTLTATAAYAAGTRLSGSLSQMPSFGGAGQFYALQLRITTGVGTAGSTFDFSGLRLRYVSDKTGASTTS